MCNAGEKVNVAVVGLGFMGVTHLRAYLDHPQAQVTAICGNTRLPVNGILAGVAGNIQKSNGIVLGSKVKVFQKFEELLADPKVDLVDVCTPTALHPAQTMAALKAGKHVLCEKPLARTSAAAREILQVAQNSAGFFMPAMCMRFWPGWSWLKQVVTEQTFGTVLAARFSRLSEMPAWSRHDTYSSDDDSGGALFDLHIHDTDFANHLFGRPASVFSTGVSSPRGAISHVVTQYHYPGGPVVHAEGGWLLPQGFNMSYTLHCERATLNYDLSRGADALLVNEVGHAPRVVKVDGTDGYAGEINYFIDCVANGRPPQVVTARDGVTALEICEAEETSIRSSALIKF